MMQSAHILLRPMAIGAFRVIDRLRPKRHQYILILSHMRSGSSPLLHLLMTSPEISGCGERNTAYLDDRDLIKLAIKANFSQKNKRRARYSVDQINHTHFLPTESLLLNPSVLPILLFREPTAAVSSMVDVFKIYKFDLDDGINHYRERVTTLTHYARLLRQQGRVLALTYDELIVNTPTSLLRLENYLGLHSTLEQNYSTYSFTGTRGDPSVRIHAGQILSGRTDHGVDIQRTTRTELTDIYNECVLATR